MSKSQSWKDLAPEGEKVADLRRPSSQPLHATQATTNEHSLAAVNSSSKSSMDDMRRRIVQLNKELEQERTLTKNLRRDKALVVKQVRDEEQRKAIAMQTELRSKLHKEKKNELTALKEQIRKEKEKEITQIIRQKDELLKTAQQAWGKERDELKLKIRNELRGETREDSKREFEKERGKMEQEIADLHRQKLELDETLKLVQDADKRKVEDIRRTHHEHEAELDRFKRNSWQESRQQMAEIRQLLNIIEQLEKKLGLEAGHSMRLRLEKDNLHDMLKKSTTFDTWDRMMSSGKSEQATPPGIPDSKGNSQELRMLQRKNVELSSLVRKLDEKNQQLATRNAELLAELEKLEKENKEKNRKLERKNTDLAQTNKRFESRNKLLLDEVNSLKRTLTRRKENTVKQRGPANEEDELGELKAQVREQTRTIADLKQSIMEKDRRIELLRSRKKKSKQQPVSHSLQLTDLSPVIDDDALSVNSDLSEASEVSSGEDIDSKRIKKLAKELLALERAYALLQAQVSSTVDAERDEMAKQQLQSDLLESQTRIHELERMIDSGQGSGLQEICNLQEDNKALYQKLVAAEQARDKAQSELDKYSEDMQELQDQRDLLEFELEEMSQLSTAGSEDWDSRRSRNGVESFSLPRILSSGTVVLTLEEVKALLEELGKEKDDVMSPVQQSALKQARLMLESMDEKIHYMEITEMALRDKVRDLDLGYNSESLKSDLDETGSLSVPTCDRETLTDLTWTELDNTERYQEQRIEAVDYHARARVLTEDKCSMTDLTGEDWCGLKSVDRNYPLGFPERDMTNGKSDKDFMTDLAWRESGELEESHRNVHSFALGKDKGIRESNMDIESHKNGVGIVTDLSLSELALMEMKYLESIENPHEDKSDVVTERDEVAGFSSVELVETLPEIVLDTFAEDPTCTKDQCEMTELRCDHIAKLNDKCVDYKHSLEELKKRIALLDVEKKEKSCSTELTWNDIVSLQEKCYGYECIISELEDKISLFKVEKKDKNSFTELSLQDLVGAKFNADAKEAETITSETDFSDSDVLPEIVFETYPGAETKDDGETIHGVWEEVVDLKNTYRDYRENLEDMKNKLAQFQVEKDDKESITDIAMQDLADLESLYKEHLHDADSDSNSMLSHAEKESRQCMTELTFVELSELEDFYIENAARQEETPPVVEKWEQENMTEITYDHLQYLKEVEELYRQKTNAGADEEVGKEEKCTATDLTVTDLNHLLEGAYDLLRSCAEKTDKTTSTDVTIPVLELLQQTEKLHQICTKVDKCVATEVTIGGLQYWEQEEKVHWVCLNGSEDEKAITDIECRERYDVEICTDLTMIDLQYLENTHAAHEECLRGKSEEFGNKKSEVERLTVETMTYLTASDLKDDENVETANEVCFAEKYSVETMTDFTLSDLNDLEAVKGPMSECTLERNKDFTFVDKESVEVMTDLTSSDLKYLKDVEVGHEECLADKQEELDCRTVDKESVEVMTDLTASDLKYLEDIEVAHEECLANIHEEPEAATAKKENAEVMTDLSVFDLQRLEDVDASHMQCLFYKDSRKERSDSPERISVETMTDMNFQVILETASAENEKRKEPKWRRRSRSTSVFVNMQSKHTMTELTANILEYFEDIEVLYKKTLVEYDDFRKFHSVEKVEKDSMTVTADEDLKYLKDEKKQETEEKEVMTELAIDDLDYLLSIENRHNNNELGRSSEEMNSMRGVKTMTSAALVSMECMEDEYERPQQEQSQEKDLSWVVIEQENTSSELQYLEEVELSRKGYPFGAAEIVSSEDAEVMTDLTTADLEYLEEAENLLRSITDNGSELSGMLAPKEDKEVMTELTKSDTDHLYTMGDIYADDTKALSNDSEVEKDDKGTETELTVADIRDLQDQADSASEKRATPSFHEFVRENFQGETFMDLQSELDYLPVLDEPEFIMDEDEDVDIEESQSRDACVVTELTFSDLQHLGITDACDGVGLPHLRREQTDIGVQCALEDLSSLLEELSREAEEKGADVPSWFVTALKMRQPGVFNPIHLVVRQTNEIDTTPTVDRQNLGATLEHVIERTQMSRIPIDMPHVSEGSHGCFLSNNETNLLPSGASAASLKNIGVQCDLDDVDAMLTKFRRIHPHDVHMPLFVSAMKMTRQDTGFNSVEVVLRNRNDSNPVQDEVATEPNNSFITELSRPPLPPTKASFTTCSPPPVQCVEEEQSEFPEADNPLLSSQNKSDSVLNRIDEATDPFPNGEGRDILTDMPRDGSAVNRFNKFLKERKDSELRNLMALRQGMDDCDQEGTGDIKNLKELEAENDLLRKQLLILENAKGTEDLEDENRHLWEKLEEMTEELDNESTLLKEKVQDVKNTEKENGELREKVKAVEEASLRVKELEGENEILNGKIKALESSVDDVVCENTLLKVQIKELEQNDKLQELKVENNMLKDKIHSLEDASNIEFGRNKDASVKKQFKVTEETRKREKELEDENEVLQEKVQILAESLSSERLENEQLLEKIQDLEHSTGRVVEKLEEENSVLKENIQILEDTTSNMKTLEDENTLLREKIESLYSTKMKDMSKVDFETLQKKIEQLKEAEKTIAALNESNTAMKARIDILLSEKKTDKDVSTDMDPSEQLGKADRLVQSDVGDTPCSVSEPIQHLPGIPGRMNQVNLPLPENITKELENLKQENRRLCEELKELRRTVEDRQNTERLNEETQTDYADSSEDIAARSFEKSRDVPSSIPGSIKETIAPQVRSTVAAEIRYLGDSRLEFEPSPQSRYKEGTAFSGKDDPMDYSALVRDFENTIPSHNESTLDSDDLISEPEVTVSRRNLDNQMDIIDQRIEDLRCRGEKHPVLTQDASGDRQGFGDLVIINSDDEGDLPPLPESSPPPLPSELPPDFTESSPPVLHGLEVLLNSDSSPPRDAATLRASSRQRLYSENKPSSEASQPSSRMESPVLVEETTLVLESEPSELGGIYPSEEPTPLVVSSGRRPTDLRSIKPDDSKTRVTPQVLPRPKRLLLQKREPGPLNQPVVSYANSNAAWSLPSQWLHDEEDGIIPPRGVVLNRTASINRGEIDALNEKIGFLEGQLKNKENVIRSLKTEATELETQSLLERKDREVRILDEDVAFLKEENQKKEKELLTKIGEINEKNREIEQWKAEASNSERQRQRMEAAYMNLQNQQKSLHGAERVLAELQTKYSGMEKQNFELSEKVKKLEKSEKEFKKLEHSIQILQAKLQEMDIMEQDRNNLIEKMKAVENQRDDLLRKGRMVETERNDFLRKNKLVAMQRDDLDRRCSVLQKTNTTLSTRLAQLEHDVKEAHTKMHDSQHERNFLKVQLEKMEAERNEMQTRLALTTQKRNSLENQVAELHDLNRDHVKLEDSFHSLRIQLAESTRQKDDAEMQILTLKAKISLLRRACGEKDNLVEKLNEEICDLRHFISTSAFDDLSKIRSFGFTHDNFTKLATHRDREKQIAEQVPKLFKATPPGTKKAKRFIALCDYHPRNSPLSEHPELELKLKEGDLLTVFGDMDINGYFEADVSGERGLVPSLYVEEVEDENDSDLALEEQLTSSHKGALQHGALTRNKEVQLHPDIFSCLRGSSSSGASSTGLEKRQCLVALHDYDPFCSGVPGWPPHDQLPLKKGDIMTTLEDQDANGFYRVFLKGQTGLVPGQMVEKESLSLLRQPVNNQAPEQILGMLNNNPGRGQPGTASDHATPLPSMGSVMSLTHAGSPNGPQLSLNHMRLAGSPSKVPNVELTKFKPSPDVDMLGVMASVTQSSQQLFPLSSQKPAKISSSPAASIQIVPSVSTKSRSKKVRPSVPSNFRIIRPVNHDAMLLGWTLPEMDEFGRSSGLSVKGYKISVNDDVRLDVRSPYMAKALVEGLELSLPIKFSIQTVAENGASSETVTATFDDAIKESLLDSREEYFEDLEDGQQYRTFVALYDYDPFKSSPNQNPAAEMSFKEGDILKVFNTFRRDGYFVGKLKNNKGLIPSNFVEEVAVASTLRLTTAKRRKAALPSPTRPQSAHCTSVGSIGLATVRAKNPVVMNKKLMVALYDYNPEMQSPQDNPDSELPLRKGQIFAVLGDMRADGFYQAEVNGELGLVPGSFLDKFTTGGTSSGLGSGISKPTEQSGS